jgi:predicted esterase
VIAAAPPPHGGMPVLTHGRPLGEGRVVVIAVHGRGAGPRNILDLAPIIDPGDTTWLAPAAAGSTWYPFGFMSPTDRNEPGITSGIAVVHGLIASALERGVPEGRIVLLGFSQGACLAVTSVQRRPARYGGVVVLSGGLIGPPGTAWDESGSFAGMPAFLGCSDRDPHIPEDRVHETAAVLERMGARVTERIYPGMGHTVNEEEAAVAREMIALA